MDVNQFLKMKQGDGEFCYAQNTLIQRSAAMRTRNMIEKAVHSLFADQSVRRCDPQILRVADLGCGFGPVPLAFVSTMIENVEKMWKKTSCDDQAAPEVKIYLNDLQSNDFNILFGDMSKLLQQKQLHDNVISSSVEAVPGSFHGRLFPPNSLHFVHSNYAVHWLSQVPPGLRDEHGSAVNKGNIHISESSPPATAKAYYAQFQKDWTFFLQCRYEELVSSGYLVLVVPGKPSGPIQQPIFELQLLSQAISSLVFQGMIKEEKLDTFDIPAYCPMKEEIEEVVQTQGCFEIEHLETKIEPIAEEVEDAKKRQKLLQNV